MKNKVFFLFTLFYSSLFADWSTPRDVAIQDSAYTSAFDGQGNAIVIHAKGSELIQDTCTLGSRDWKSRSLGKVSQPESFIIVNDSKGDPYLFWAEKSEKVCRFFYLPLLKPARPTLLWYGPKDYESLEVMLNKEGDLYCRMVASEDDAVAVLQKGSTKWDVFQRSLTSDRQQQQYQAKLAEFNKIESFKLLFPAGSILADSPCLDDQGQLRVCWFEKVIGVLSWRPNISVCDAATVKFGTIDQEGKLNEDYSKSLGRKTVYSEGAYHIDSEGAHEAVFANNQSVMLFRLDEGKITSLDLEFPSTHADEIQIKSCKEGRYMATWLEDELLRVSIYE